MTDMHRLLERVALLEGRLMSAAQRADERYEQMTDAVGGALAKYFAHAIAPIVDRIAAVESGQRQLNGKLTSLDGRNDKKRDVLAKLVAAREEREAGQAAIERELV